MAWEQLNNSIVFYFFFLSSRQGKTGLTVSVDVYNPAGTKVVTAGAATEIGGGFYAYTLASASVTSVGEYVAIGKTTDTTVDQQHLPALWIVGRDGDEHLDADVSSRSTFAPATDTVAHVTLCDTVTTNTDMRGTDSAMLASSYSAPPSSATIATAVRDVNNTAPAANSLGASINSRSTFDPATDTVAHVTLVDTTTTNTDMRGTDSALLASGYTAPDNTTIGTISTTATAIKAKTDNLPASPAAVGSAMVLASNGLDSISITAPTGVASNFREMMVQVWRRFFKKATKSSSAIETFADDGTTVLTTQAISVSGSDETQGAAS